MTSADASNWNIAGEYQGLSPDFTTGQDGIAPLPYLRPGIRNSSETSTGRPKFRHDTVTGVQVQRPTTALESIHTCDGKQVSSRPVDLLGPEFPPCPVPKPPR